MIPCNLEMMINGSLKFKLFTLFLYIYPCLSMEILNMMLFPLSFAPSKVGKWKIIQLLLCAKKKKKTLKKIKKKKMSYCLLFQVRRDPCQNHFQEICLRPLFLRETCMFCLHLLLSLIFDFQDLGSLK